MIGAPLRDPDLFADESLHGFIVLDPELAANSDLERSILANLELAKVRGADRQRH